jgi:Leucine-rich repeat (LRR) protein
MDIIEEKIMNDTTGIISLTNLKLKTIPVIIHSLTHLVHLDLSHNKINDILGICNLTQLEYLNLSNNIIRLVPKKLFNLLNLTDLKLKNTRISYIPDEIGKLTKLLNLNITFNQIEKIPKQIENLLNLKYLNLSYNNILNIPEELFKLTNIKEIDLSKNKISTISKNIQSLTNLEQLNINTNDITMIPIEIIHCTNLQKFSYHNNEIDYIPFQVIRFLDKINNIIEIQVYNDNQNVHNHSIQQSISSSISKIMATPLKSTETIIMDEILNDDILTSKTKELLIEYSNHPDYHGVLLITFKELLMYVWELIQENEHKNEIKTILNNEILDAECKCFTGRLTRLLNCLNGFNDLIEIKISDNQQIGNIIVLLKNELDLRNEYTIDKHKQLVEKELKERGYDDTMIEEWVNYI